MAMAREVDAAERGQADEVASDVGPTAAGAAARWARRGARVVVGCAAVLLFLVVFGKDKQHLTDSARHLAARFAPTPAPTAQLAVAEAPPAPHFVPALEATADDGEVRRDLGRKRKKKQQRRTLAPSASPTTSPTAASTTKQVPEAGCESLNKKNECEAFEGCDFLHKACRPAITPKRILFVGNSFTIRNKMTNMVEKMAKERFNAKVYMAAWGSYTWSKHLDTASTRYAINYGGWDAIVFQEQSFFLSSPMYYHYSARAGQELYNATKGKTKRVLLFETWGYEYGRTLGDNYFLMQSRIQQGYRYAASKMEQLQDGTGFPPISIAPVGTTWAELYDNHKDSMYTYDSQHPDMLGSYITACVFYAQIFEDSPVGLSYRPKGVTAKEAEAAQKAAAKIVLG